MVGLAGADIIEARRDTLAKTWVEIERSYPGSPYRDIPLPQLNSSIQRAIESLITHLRTGSLELLYAYLESLIRLRLAVNFPIGDLTRALADVKPALRANLTDLAPETRESILVAADDWLRCVLHNLTSRYAAGMQAKLAQQLDQLERKVREVTALNRSAAILNASLDLTQVLPKIAHQAAQLIDGATCVLCVYDVGEMRLCPRASAGPGIVPPVRLRPFDARQARWERFVNEREPILVEDTSHDGHDLQQSDIGALFALPLTRSDDVLGALIVAYPIAHTFSSEEVTLLSTFADHAALALANAHLYERSCELAAAQERTRLAREMHDTLTQSLVGLGLQLRVARQLRDGGEYEQCTERLKQAEGLAQYALAQARALVWKLREKPAEQLPLPDALRDDLEAFRAQSGIQADLIMIGTPLAVPERVQHHLIRLLNESLSNVSHHAQAAQVVVWLAFSTGGLEMAIRDDGVGFDVEQQGVGQGHFGLIGMRERARLLEGTFTIESAPGHGTQIRVWVPLSVLLSEELHE